MKKLLKLLADTSGNEIAEFAVVLPLLFVMLFAIYSFGRAYNIYSTVTRAAQEGARVAVTPVCATCAAFSCGGTPGQFPCASTVVDTVKSVLQSSHIDPNGIAALTPATPDCPAPAPVHSCQVSSNVTVCSNVLLNTTTTNTALQACGSVVSFKYPYQFLPMIGLAPINIPAQAQMRMEY